MGLLWQAGQRITTSMMNQYYSHSDTTDTAVVAASQQQLTTSYTIPANEPSTDSSYTIKFGGTGQQGSTQQLLTFTVVLQGVVLVVNSSIAASAFAINAAFRFEGEARLICASLGATGGFRAGIHINLAEIANPIGSITAASNNLAYADGNSAAGVIDTTSNMLAVVKCGWAGTVGAPTITNRHTIFSKVS